MYQYLCLYLKAHYLRVTPCRALTLVQNLTDETVKKQTVFAFKLYMACAALTESVHPRLALNNFTSECPGQIQNEVKTSPSKDL